jgi:AhpD family alkylhydroperoxidase
MTHAPNIDYQEFTRLAPDSVAGLSKLSASASASGLDKGLIELVKIRVSQLNGCAFCLQYPLNLARKLGVAPEKLDLVAAWRDAGVFSAQEEAALTWAEQLTLMAAAEIPAGAYPALRAQFSENEAVFLSVAIATINAWNRLGAGLRFSPIPLIPGRG